MNKKLLFSLVEETWSVYIDQPLTPIAGEVDRSQFLFECFIEIPIVGQHKFLLVLAATRALAEKVAVAFFQQPAEELNDADITDAISELANMIAGRVQQYLAEDTELQLPKVIEKESAFSIMAEVSPEWQVYSNMSELTLYVGIHESLGELSTRHPLR